MIVVTGVFEVDPSEGEEFIRSREDSMRRTRDEDGCLEYVFAVDPIEPGRVVLTESWRDEAALSAHLAAFEQPSSTIEIRSACVEAHSVAESKKLV